MKTALLMTVGTVLVVAVTLAAHWLSCRLRARPCPACGSKWRTELEGEMDGVEFWVCHRCRALYDHKIPEVRTTSNW